MKKRLLALGLALAMLFACSACAADGETAADDQISDASEAVETAADVPGLDVSEDVTLYFVGQYDNFEALEAVITDFTQVYPNCTVIYEKLDNYYEDGLAMRLALNENVDLFMEYDSCINGDAIRDNYALNLMDIGLNLTQINSSVLPSSLQNGELYKLPVGLRMFGMLVNEDILEKVGVQIPTTYTELCNACDALISAGYTTPVLGFNNDLFSNLMVSELQVSVSTAENVSELAESLNTGDETAGDYLLPFFEKAAELAAKGYINTEVNAQIADNYEATLLRFMEGDVPFMVASGTTFSGSAKREKKSEAFQKSPFTYSFMPSPMCDEGYCSYANVFTSFSVNKNSENLEWASEFMRFLCTSDELNTLAATKRIYSVSATPQDTLFKLFNNVPAERIVLDSNTLLHNKPVSSFSAAALDMIMNGWDINRAIEAFYEYMAQ